MKDKLRYRADGFTPKKQRKFLKVLSKSGCVRDACRKVRISSTTAYRTRDKLPDFAGRWATAREMAGSDIEILAWDRAMKGVDQVIIRKGEVVEIRRKPSDSVFRLLMQGANPRKYGTMQAMRRDEIEKKVLAKRLPRVASNAEVREALTKALEAFRKRQQAKRDSAANEEPPRGLDGEGI